MTETSKAETEARHFLRFMGQAFASTPEATFAVARADGALIVVARVGTTRERDLLSLTREWGARVDEPKGTVLA